MATYSDQYGNFFGRLNDDENVDVLHIENGENATRLDCTLYPVNSNLSCRYEHPEGIVLTVWDAKSIGLDIEE